MAARLEKNLRDDYLTCSICLSIFKEPRQLPCGHSYCLQCLLDYMKPQNTILLCPTCRDETKCPHEMDVANWINTLSPDHVLIAVVKAVENNSSIRDEDIDDNPNATIHGCKDHSKILDYFCFDHCGTICSECVATSHSHCDYFPLSDVQLKVLSILNENDCNLENRLQKLAKAEQYGLHSLVSYQRQKMTVQKHLEMLKTNFEKFSEKIRADLDLKLESLHWPEVNMKSALKNILITREHLEQTRYEGELIKDESDAITRVKAATLFQRKSNDIVENDTIDGFGFKQYHVKFQENQDMASVIKSITDFGKLEIITANEMEQKVVETSLEPDSEETSLQSEPETHYQFYHKREFWVNENIGHYCSLSGCTIIDNCVVLVDQYNNCIIKMTFDGRLVEKFPLNEPHQVCRLTEHRVAVTCWDKNKLFILGTEPNISIIGTFTTMKHYLGVHGVGHNRILATSSDSCIDVLSITGDILVSINANQSRNILSYIFKRSLSVPIKAIMKDTNIITYDSMQKSLLCLDLEGNIKWKKKIPGISGFSCGGEDIYCTLSLSNKVITVGFDGIVKDQSFLKIKRPWAIDVVGTNILVTEDSPSGRVHFVKLGS